MLIFGYLDVIGYKVGKIKIARNCRETKMDFGNFDLKTLKNCREVFALRYGKDWDLWFQRHILVQGILEFGNKVSDFIPGWNNAVEKFGKKASLNDLNEVKGSLNGLEDNIEPLHYAARNGHVKLMELLFQTNLDINTQDSSGFTPFMEACWDGQTEIVNLMLTASEEYGIDLNARDDFGRTGFMIACYKGHTEIVNLMITASPASEEYGIDPNARDDFGRTGFMIACFRGHTETVNLMIENRTKYGINIQQETN